MIEIEKPKIECVESTEDNTYGKFVVEPLERYGAAAAILRRILLSSLPGVAVTSIKIAGCFMSFDGTSVIEDVTEIILNVVFH